MSCLHGVAGHYIRDRVRSSDIQEGLRVKPLLLCIEARLLVRMTPWAGVSGTTSREGILSQTQNMLDRLHFLIWSGNALASS